MFCTKCGKQCSDGAKFCTGCGAPLTPPAPRPAPGPSKAPGGKWKVPLFAVLGLAAVIVVCVALFGGDKLGGGDKPSAGNRSSPRTSSRSTPRPDAEPTTEPTEAPADSPYEVETITYENGDVYEGETLDGVPWGWGKMTYAGDGSGDCIYYEGEWNNGKRQGQGTMTWANGAVYEGEWDDDLRHGEGTYITNRGDIYTGAYVHGKRDGDFQMVTPAGETYALVYEMGDEISRTALDGSGSVPATQVTAKPKAPSGDADGTLPDPGAFFQCARNEDEASTGHGSDGWLVSYSFDLDTGEAGVDEFIDLLEEDRYHLRSVGTDVDDYIDTSASKFEDYYFEYTGDRSAGILHDWKDGPASNVHVLVGYYYDEGRIGLTFYYGAGLTLADPGDRASKLPTDFVGSSGGSSSGSSSSGSFGGSSSGITPRIPCTAIGCDNGKVECSACDGDGGKWVYDNSTPHYDGTPIGGSKTWESCFKCGGSKEMRCDRCGGDGWID